MRNFRNIRNLPAGRSLISDVVYGATSRASFAVQDLARSFADDLINNGLTREVARVAVGRAIEDATARKIEGRLMNSIPPMFQETARILSRNASISLSQYITRINPRTAATAERMSADTAIEMFIGT